VQPVAHNGKALRSVAVDDPHHAGQDSFPLTQEFLSQMLGVRRATVNAATGTLKKKGLIQYVRGHISIIDRGGLESASCGCHQAAIQVYSSILGTPDRRI
jgi:Mn-dependent DtxR family transcriptional regulator